MTTILPQGSTSADLQAAVDSAASGDVLVVSGDMPFTAAVTIPAGKEISIQSDGSNNWVMSQAAADMRHFTVTGSLILQNITLDGGSAGGGIDMPVVGGLLALNSGAVVKNCKNSGNGGGVNVNDGIITIDGGHVIHNISGDNGGGIYSTGLNSSVRLLKGAIESNNSKNRGGGICAINIIMRGGSVNHNYTDGGSGGGLYAMNSLELSGGEISYNEIKPASGQNTASGGGIYCSGVLSAPTTISGGKIHHNKVGATPGGSRGGGICVFRGVKFYMNGAEIYENEADWGAGMFFDAYMQYGVPEENTVITGNPFIHDNRGAQGGGICFYNNVPGVPDIGILGMAPQISGNVRITDNSANYGGGIMFYPFLGEYSRTQIMMNATISGHVEISGNKAANSGAGILIRDDNRGQGVIAALTIKDNMAIRGNEVTADTGIGGGIYAMNSNIAMQSKAQVSDNTGGNYGGGIFLSNSSLKMSGATISGNTANAGGGGIYLRANANAEITNDCLIANNHATNGDGGGLFTEDAENYGNLITDTSTVFSCNSAQAAYNPPENAGTVYPDIGFSGTSVADHPLNNFDINSVDGDPIQVTFKVAYHANGGVGGNTGPDIEEGGTDTVLSVIDAKISNMGYTFTGWNTKRDGSGAAYAPGDTITVTCGVTLYAQWKAEREYIITYDCNGGRGRYIDHCREFEVSYMVLSTSRTGISNTGSTFTAWNTAPDGSGLSFAAGQIINVSSDVVLFAQWRQIPEQKKLCPAPKIKCRRAVEGQILWVDNDNAGNTRPPSVEILLLRGGEIYTRTNVDSLGDGYFGFCCLPAWRNSIQKYNYQIDETAIPSYTTAIEGYNVINTLTP